MGHILNYIKHVKIKYCFILYNQCSKIYSKHIIHIFKYTVLMGNITKFFFDFDLKLKLFY